MKLDYTEKYEECCVCYKETCRKTIKCCHSLCTNCFTKLKKTNEELNCPYCRTILY